MAPIEGGARVGRTTGPPVEAFIEDGGWTAPEGRPIIHLKGGKSILPPERNNVGAREEFRSRPPLGGPVADRRGYWVVANAVGLSVRPPDRRPREV